MEKYELPFRQVHLDFHTSEHIRNIGALFDPEEFAYTLEKARVNSITCFARCHHGWMYYDSKKFPERVHPYLVNKNLLKEQVDACHRRGIRVPVYTSVQWDHYTARQHPEWLSLDENGYPIGQKIYEAGFYNYLCINSPYLQFLKEHTREILEMIQADGIFFDIVQVVDCSCKYCRSEMEARGLEPAKREDRIAYARESIHEFRNNMTKFVRQFNSDCSVFYNASHVGPALKDSMHAFTHFELESLPSAGWGYMDLPVTMRYARKLGKECVGQTGKFHTDWADFSSYKNREALEYECFRMLALGAKCMIGDQLEPSGKISSFSYNLIGSVYSQVEKKEPWCVGAKPITEIGVFTPEEFFGGKKGELSPAAIGATRMLEESGHQFDFIDSSMDFSQYKVLVLPDNIPVSERFAERLEQYVSSGGAVIASFESGLDEGKNRFNLNILGVELSKNKTYAEDGKLARGRYFPRNDYADYILPKSELKKGLPQTEHVMYMKGVEIEAREGTQVLADIILPYFNRTYKHFCSHMQTPSSGIPGNPAVVKCGKAIYFAHPIFTQYDRNAPRWCKKLFLNALDMLLPEPLVRHNGPTTMMVTLNEQSGKRRWILHLLHYIPQKRSVDIEIIEDVIPLYNIKISVKAPREVKKVFCAPQMEYLNFEQSIRFERDGEDFREDLGRVRQGIGHVAKQGIGHVAEQGIENVAEQGIGRVEFVLPVLKGHQIVVLEM